MSNFLQRKRRALFPEVAKDYESIHHEPKRNTHIVISPARWGRAPAIQDNRRRNLYSVRVFLFLREWKTKKQEKIVSCLFVGFLSSLGSSEGSRFPHLSNHISSQLFLFGYLNYGFKTRILEVLATNAFGSGNTTIAERVIVVYRTPAVPNADLPLEN